MVDHPEAKKYERQIQGQKKKYKTSRGEDMPDQIVIRALDRHATEDTGTFLIQLDSEILSYFSPHSGRNVGPLGQHLDDMFDANPEASLEDARDYMETYRKGDEYRFDNDDSVPCSRLKDNYYRAKKRSKKRHPD